MADTGTPGSRASLKAVARRVSLGAPYTDALEPLVRAWGRDGEAAVALLCLQRDTGGRLGDMLLGLGDSIEKRNEEAARSRAAAAGARLSARIVAGLPLLAVPIMTGSRAPMFDAPALVTNFIGVSLAITGLRWIAKLLPAPPPEDDPMAVTAEMIASAVEAGCQIDSALTAVARYAPSPIGDALESARRRVELGCGWTAALNADEALVELAGAVHRSKSLGVELAPSLRECARRSRELQTQSFELALRRGPVLMVLPLTLCVLPSFVILALVPFLRGLDLAS